MEIDALGFFESTLAFPNANAVVAFRLHEHIHAARCWASDPGMAQNRSHQL